MRVAGRMPPCTETWPTPVTSDSRGAMMVSAMSLSARWSMVLEVSASVMIGGASGVHFEIKRRVGEIARQRRAGGVDRRLHILRSGVDVARQIELQRDLA